MRRPRKATVDAHITEYPLPRFEDADWEDLERIARVPLDDVARTAIQDAASRYTEETLLQRDGAARAKMLGRPPAGRKQHKKLLPLEMFRKAIRQLVSAWNDADGDPETARLFADFAAETEYRSKRALDFQQLRVDLEIMDNCLRLFLDRMANGIVPIDGASARKTSPAPDKMIPLTDPFTCLVREFAKIFTEAGGSVTAPTLTYHSSPVSSFVAFVMRANDCVPNDVKQNHATDAAWSKAVARALRG